MDLAEASAGPWLVLGVVLGVLLAGLVALAVVGMRRGARSSGVTTAAEVEPRPVTGWVEDDLPGFLEQPPGVGSGSEDRAATVAEGVPLAAREPDPGMRRRIPAHAVTSTAAPAPGRLLLVLATAAVLLVGVAAALAATTEHEVAGRPSAAEGSADAAPTWEAPDLTVLPERPSPGDPGAGRLAAASVPIGDDGALARLTFEGLVLERWAVGVTVAYPSVSVTAVDVPGGPALAHVVLPVWNCLTDTAPDDPVAAGCRRLPTEYAELATPALTVTDDGDGLRIDGRYATYVRPGGTPPDWTGRVYPLTVHVAPDDDGDGATGTLHLGTESAAAVEDPLLSGLRRGR